MSNQNRYTEYSVSEFDRISIVDATIDGKDLIWVGCGGTNGTWLSPEQVIELASKLNAVAALHNARIASKKNNEQ